jgi:tetratricopeptide (TPR) repeat protein
MLLAVLSPLLLSGCADKGRHAFDLGAQALARGDWPACIDENTRVIGLDPSNWQAYVNRAICYLQNNLVVNAIEDANAVIRLNDSTEAGYLIRAEAYDVLERFDEAQADLEHARRLSPGSVMVWLGIARHQVNVRQFEAALAAADSALSIAPNHEAAVSLKGSILIVMRKYTQALAWLQQEMEKPNRMQSINVNNVGFAEAQLGHLSDAQKHLELALSLDSTSSIVWNNLGYVHYRIGNADTARNMVDHAISLDPANAFAHYNRGLIAISLGDTLDACGRFRNATGLGFARRHGPEADSMIDLYCGRTKRLRSH